MKPPIEKIMDHLADVRADNAYVRSYSFARFLASIANSLHDERAAWRQYACAALSNPAVAPAFSVGGFAEQMASQLADALLEQERQRFEAKKEEP